MPEKIIHRIIESNMCPRCGHQDTDFLRNDGINTGTYFCRRCEDYYDVTLSDEIKYLCWTDEDGEHKIYDSHYLAGREAMNLLAACEKMKAYITQLGYDIDFVWSDWPASGEVDGTIGRATGESHEE